MFYRMQKSGYHHIAGGVHKILKQLEGYILFVTHTTKYYIWFIKPKI